MSQLYLLPVKMSKDIKTNIWRKRSIIFVCIVLVTAFLLYIKEQYFYRSDRLKAVVFDGNCNVVLDRSHIWDQWMLDNPKFSSVGDIYDKCDNTTRTKIGKIVLEPNGEGGVKMVTYLNQTYSHDITSSTSHMTVHYKNSVLYDRDYDMCKSAKKLDTPYDCPVKKGFKLVIRDVANIPPYLPKGKFKIFAWTKDQNGDEIGCTFAEFKTGEEDEEDT